jgi:hypothetical protein
MKDDFWHSLEITPAAAFGEVVVEGRARRMVDRIAATARRATFEAEETCSNRMAGDKHLHAAWDHAWRTRFLEALGIKAKARSTTPRERIATILNDAPGSGQP